MTARRLLLSILIYSAHCTPMAGLLDEQSRVTTRQELESDQESVYNAENAVRQLACSSSAFVYPTDLPGTQYLYFETGMQTISWSFPAYDTSSGCTAPPPLIGWWASGQHNGASYYYDDYPLTGTTYQDTCSSLFDYTTCTSALLANVPWLTATDSSITVDTDSTSITLGHQYKVYPSYRYFYNYPDENTVSTRYESFFFSVNICEATSFTTDNAVTGGQIVYKRGSGLQTFQLDQILSSTPDCGYTWVFYIYCVATSCDLASTYGVTLTDTATGTLTIDLPIDTGSTTTVAAGWYVLTPDHATHAQINHLFDFVFYTAITSATWGTYATAQDGYIGIQTFEFDWPTLTLLPTIVDTVYSRSNFNMYVNGVQLYTDDALTNEAGVSWLRTETSTDKFKYYLDTINVARDGEVNVLTFDWTITDGQTFSETQSFSQTLTFICAMNSVTRANTWSSSQETITIFDTAPFTRLFEVYTEVPACGNSYTVTLSYSTDSWVTSTTVTTESWITTDHSTTLSIASSDTSMHDVIYDIKMTATFARSYGTDPEASFSVKFDDPCLSSNSLITSSISPMYLFVDQAGQGSTKIEKLLPEFDDTVNQLYGDGNPDTGSVCGGQTIVPNDINNVIQAIGSISGYVLEVYTNDMSLAGDHIVYFDYAMTDYPSVTAQESTQMYIYYIVEPNPELDPIEYQISSGPYTFTTLLHSVEPSDGQTTLSYGLLLQDGSSAPSWISLETSLTDVEIQIQSTDPTDVGEYNLILRATATHSIGTGSTYVELPFLVTLTAPLGFSVNLAPYWEEGVPESFTIEYGEAFEYTLPAFTDEEGDEIILTVELGPSIMFMTYDEESGIFSIPLGYTQESHIGTYEIQVDLIDAAFSELKTTFVLNIVGPPEDETEEDESSASDVGDFFAALIFLSRLPVMHGWDWAAQLANVGQKNYRPLPPEVKLAEITKTGLVRIEFTKDMVVPPLQVLQTVRALQSSESEDEGEVEDEEIIHHAVIARVIPGDLSPREKLTMRYNISSYTTNELQLQLDFDYPVFVSAEYSDREQLQVFFPNRYFFFDYDGLFIKDNILLTRTLPSQMDPNSFGAQLAAQGENIATGSTALMAGNFVLNFFLSAGLNQMLSLIETQQILLVPPLFMLALPANAAIFFKFVMEIAAFDLIPTDILYEWAFGWDDTTDSINTNFEDEGFGSTLFLFNIGSILLLCILWIPFLLLHMCCACFIKFFCCGRQDRCWPDRRYKLRNCVFWTHPALTLYESYFVICLCTFINLAYVSVGSPQEQFSYVLTTIFLAVCFGYPIVLLIYLCHNYDRLRLKSYKARCGAMFERLDLKKGRLVLIAPVWFLLRRFILALICVQPPGKTLFFQFMIMQYTIYVQVVIGGFIEPLKSKSERRTETINEVIITFIFYTFFCFSDLVPDPETRAFVGLWSCIFVVLHFLANVGVIVYITVAQCREKARKKRMKRRQKQLIADGIIESKEQRIETKRKDIVEKHIRQLSKLEEVKELDSEQSSEPPPKMSSTDRRKLQAKLDKMNSRRQKAIELELDVVRQDFLNRLGQVFDEVKQAELTERSPSQNEVLGVMPGQYDHLLTDKADEELVREEVERLKIPLDYFANGFPPSTPQPDRIETDRRRHRFNNSLQSRHQLIQQTDSVSEEEEPLPQHQQPGSVDQTHLKTQQRRGLIDMRDVDQIFNVNFETQQ